jgi:hypothetical protein
MNYIPSEFLQFTIAIGVLLTTAKGFMKNPEPTAAKPPGTNPTSEFRT